MLTSLEMVNTAVSALNEKKARDIKVLKTEELTTIADYFVICTANSTTHIKTLSDEVTKALEDRGENPLRIEGHRGGGWVLVDFGCVVVHLFLKDIREFYAIEHLWNDAPEVDISGVISE